MPQLGTNLATKLGTTLGVNLAGSGVVPPVDPIIALNPFARWRADSGIPPGSTVASWTDMQNGHVLNAPGTQPPLITSDAAFGGRPSVRFNSAATTLLSNEAAAVWKFIHDYTGSEVIAVLVKGSGTLIVYGLTRLSGNPGFSMFFNTTSGVQGSHVSGTNDAASVVLNYSTSIPPLGYIENAHYIENGLSGADNPKAHLYGDGALYGSNNTLPGTMANPPATTLTLAGAASTDWRIAELIVFNRKLNATDRGVVQGYVVGRYPIPDLRLPRYVVKGFSASNRYTTSGGEAGSATGFGVAILYRVDAALGSNEYLASKVSAAGGWEIQTQSGSLRWRMYNGAAAQVFSQSVALTANGWWDVVLCLYDGSSVRIFRARNEITPGTSATGFTAASIGTPQTLGCGMANGAPATNIAIAACMTFQGVPTAQEILDLYKATKAAGDLPSTFGSTTVTHLWSVKRDFPAAGAAGNLTDQVGSDTMTLDGALSVLGPNTNQPWAY